MKTADDYAQAVIDALEKGGYSAKEAWDKFNPNNREVLLMPDVMKGLREICGEDVTGADIKMFMQSFDTNKNGAIEKDEFYRMLRVAPPTPERRPEPVARPTQPPKPFIKKPEKPQV